MCLVFNEGESWIGVGLLGDLLMGWKKKGFLMMLLLLWFVIMVWLVLVIKSLFF
jgi:hypothetical protein